MTKPTKVEPALDNTDTKVSPQGAIDNAICRAEVIFVSGWVFWSDADPRASNICIRSQMTSGEASEVLLPLLVIQSARPDVNKYLGVNPEIPVGFSGRTHLGDFTLDTLPVGLADIVAVDPKAEFEPIKIGEISISWPESPFQVKDPAKSMPSSSDDDTSAVTIKSAEKIRKPQGFFDRLWNGRQAYDTKMIQAFGQDETRVTASGLIRSVKSMKDKSSKTAFNRTTTVERLASRIQAASDNDGLIVIIDHDYGGGANTYSKALTSGHVASGNGVLRVWHTVSEGAYHARFMTQNESTDIDIESGNELFRLLSSVKSFAIQMNSMWTYPETYQFLDNLLRLRLYGYTKRLEFFVHDNMALCPSLFLIDHKGTFCGVPDDLKTCSKCLKRNMQDFKAYYPKIDITAWRKAWQSLLLNADLIRFFSDSTHKNFQRAYPWLEDNPNVVIQGHDVPDIWARRYSPERALKNKGKDTGLRIGVFGYISEHKGSHVLRGLSDAIIKKGDDSRILVFGSLDGLTTGRVGAIDMMGPYAPADLPDLCEDNGIDIAFVPSICAETFSFITKELSIIGIPTASFDLGGQADILKRFDQGHILKMETSASLLNQFKALEKVISKA